MNSLELKTNNRTVEIDGQTYRLDFDMQALSFAEQVYLTQYERDVNVSQIIEDLFAAKASAIAAFIFAAMRSAGEKVAWEKFSKQIFTYDHFSELWTVATEAIEAILAPDDGTATTADAKN